MLPSHNCIIIITMFSFQGTWFEFLVRSSMKLQIFLKFQSTSNLITLHYYLLLGGSGGPKWTRTIDLTIISRVL